MTKVVADEGKIGFFGLYAFYSTNLFYRFLLKYIAAQAVNCVGWVDDGSAAF